VDVQVPGPAVRTFNNDPYRRLRGGTLLHLLFQVGDLASQVVDPLAELRGDFLFEECFRGDWWLSGGRSVCCHAGTPGALLAFYGSRAGFLRRYDRQVKAVGDAVFQQPLDVAALLGALDDDPDLLLGRGAAHGKIDVHGFHEAFLVRPRRGRRPGDRYLPRPRGDLQRNQQAAAQRAQERGDGVGGGAVTAQRLRLVEGPAQLSGPDPYGERITACVCDRVPEPAGRLRRLGAALFGDDGGSGGLLHKGCLAKIRSPTRGSRPASFSPRLIGHPFGARCRWRRRRLAEEGLQLVLQRFLGEEAGEGVLHFAL